MIMGIIIWVSVSVYVCIASDIVVDVVRVI